jgi:ring-1,2-phenylacetyl-CoA epoxidase subunit PaaE
MPLWSFHYFAAGGQKDRNFRFLLSDLEGNPTKTSTFTFLTIIRTMQTTTLHALEVKEVKRETPDCVSVSFAVPENLKETFSYLSGQYLALETEIDGEKVRRSYSLCSAPNEGEWKVAIKKVPNGKFSTYANEVLTTGTTLGVMAPTGNFKIQDASENEKHYVGFAAGSGITPILSMIKEVLSQSETSRFTLFYGNKGFDHIIFREELEALKNKYLGRFALHHVLSREKLGSPLFYGRINGDKCKVFHDKLLSGEVADQYVLCGPSEMIFSVKEALEEVGVDSHKIKFELFTSDGLPNKDLPRSKEEASFDPKVESKLNIILDGENQSFNLTYGGKNILDAALENGADLPFACKGGVCSTCKAKVTQGEVIMDVNYALEPDEVAAGFVLTCQAHPRTAEVTVNFDDTTF